MRGERARVGERLVNKPPLLRAQRGLAYFGRPLYLRRAWMLLLLLLFLASRHCVCIFYSHAFPFLAASHFLMFPFPFCVCVCGRVFQGFPLLFHFRLFKPLEKRRRPEMSHPQM